MQRGGMIIILENGRAEHIVLCCLEILRPVRILGFSIDCAFIMLDFKRNQAKGIDQKHIDFCGTAIERDLYICQYFRPPFDIEPK